MRTARMGEGANAPVKLVNDERLCWPKQAGLMSPFGKFGWLKVARQGFQLESLILAQSERWRRV